jgi:hypothetical protein
MIDNFCLYSPQTKHDVHENRVVVHPTLLGERRNVKHWLAFTKHGVVARDRILLFIFVTGFSLLYQVFITVVEITEVMDFKPLK